MAKDEAYIIDLCDELLNIKAKRQHHFVFLRGDSGRMLPVDAYYEPLKLVIEYHERQHYESILHFDKPSKLTCSGVSRGEQRKLYDERRRTVLPANGIKLLVLRFCMFPHDSSKRLKRLLDVDASVIVEELKGHSRSSDFVEG